MESSVNSSTSSTITTTPSSSKPAASFANLLLNEINYQDVNGLLDVQRSLLEQLDKTNEKLDGANKFCTKQYLDAQRDFTIHTQMLTTMKNDLDLIFKRIKILKIRLNKKYPSAYNSVIQMNATENDSPDDDDDISDLSTSMKPMTSPTLVKSQTIDCASFSPATGDSQSLTSLTNTVDSEKTID